MQEPLIDNRIDVVRALSQGVCGAKGIDCHGVNCDKCVLNTRVAPREETAAFLEGVIKWDN